jgi:hypothetical protein
LPIPSDSVTNFAEDCKYPPTISNKFVQGLLIIPEKFARAFLLSIRRENLPAISLKIKLNFKGQEATDSLENYQWFISSPSSSCEIVLSILSHKRCFTVVSLLSFPVPAPVCSNIMFTTTFPKNISEIREMRIQIQQS